MLAPALRAFGPLLFLAVSSSAAPAEAAPVHGLAYDVPATCPGAVDFVGRVRAHAPGVSLRADGAPAEDRLDIAVEAHDGGHRGRLRRIVSGRSTAAREVEGTRCEEVLDALALIAALGLDPTAGPRLEAQAAAPAPPRPNGAAAPAEVVPSAFAGATALALFPPGPMPGLVVGGSVRRAGAAAGPLLLVSALLAANDVLADPGRSRFSLVSLRGELCPVGWAPAARVVLHACARAEAGLLNAEGRRLENPRRLLAPWLTAGAALRLRVALGARLFLETDAGAVVPYRRTEYVATLPRERLARTPAVVAGGGLGLGVHFP
jgi:hypothetical protein